MASNLRLDSSHAQQVSFDAAPVGVSNFSMYSNVGNIDQALKIPLGSQLALLNAANAGNPYLAYSRVYTPQLAPNAFQNSYSSMGQNSQGDGSFMTFSQAYSAKM